MKQNWKSLKTRKQRRPGSQNAAHEGVFLRPEMLFRYVQVIKHLRYLVYPPVLFKSARLASEHVPFKRT